MSADTEILAPDAAQKPSQPDSMLAIIHAATQNDGIDPEKLGKLLDVQERWEANNARKEYAKALAQFQRRCPIIKREHLVKTKSGADAYRFATYDDIYRQIKALLEDCGLSISFSSVGNDKALEITCTITHIDGHSEKSTFNVPIPGMTQLVNDAQRAGSALSYARRYSLCAALNIVVSDEDDDGAAAGAGPVITAKQVDELNELLTDSESDRNKFNKYFKIDRLENMPQSRFGEAQARLEEKLQQKISKENGQS